MSHQLSLTRILTALAAASMLAACQGGSASAPAIPPQNGSAGTQSAARSSADHHASAPNLSANPSSLRFTADQAAAGMPQIVTISATSSDQLAVTIAGTGNCPLVSPAMLQPKRSGGDDDGDHRGGDDRDRGGDRAATGVVTVTPHGAGPATCLITVTKKHGDSEGRDRHDAGRRNDGDDHDGDRHDGDDHGTADALTIPVTVDAAPIPTPTPVASPTPCFTRNC